MNRLGMLVDVSHIAPAGFWDVIETSFKPIIATHSDAKALCAHPRNLDDKQILAINENNGLIGITFAGQFLENDYHDACIESVYKHIDHMLNLMGNDDHLGFGSDFDGISHPPYNIQGVQDYKPLIEYLLQRKLHQSSTTGKKINKSEFLFYLLLSHLHFTFFTAQKIHLSCALPSGAFPFLLPNRLFDAFRFTDLFFHLKPRLFYSHTFTAKFSYKFLFGGKVEFILGGKNALIMQGQCIANKVCSFICTKVQKYLQKHAISSKKDNVSLQKSQ